jgi:transposase
VSGARPSEHLHSGGSETYKQRNTVERAINELKDFRVVTMRTDKRELVLRGTVYTASIRLPPSPTDQERRDAP